LSTYPAEALYAKRRQLLARGLTVYDFSVGDPIEPTDGAIVDAFKGAVPAISQYPSIWGLAEFRRACASWIERRFGVALDPERQVLPCSGAKEAVFHLPLTFIDPTAERRTVLYGVPGYPVYERGTLLAGGEIWPVELRPETQYRLEPWTLPEERVAKTAILWINYPHNPTGATIDRAYLERLVVFCADHGILLCSDECYVDLYFDARPPSILEITRDGVLAFHSLSKRSGMTGYRSGFIAGDGELITLLRETRASFGVASTDMTQRAAIAAWNDDRHAEQRRQVFRRKRDLLLEFFKGAGISAWPCAATLYLWVRTPEDLSALDYAERLADLGILVSPAPQLGVDQPYVRLALVPDLDRCRQAIEIWGHALERA
jgi:succinyldiaminopimelate transaminase